MKLCNMMLYIILSIPMLLYAQSWSCDNRITETPVASFTSFNNARCIAVGSDSVVYTVWTEKVGFSQNQYGVYYCRSFNFGVNWTGILDLYAHSGTSARSPSIAVAGNNVHVVFVVEQAIGNIRGKIYYMKSTDGGYYWTNPMEITSDWYNNYPTIVVDNDNPQYINVIWQSVSGTNTYIKTVQSSNSGTSWGTIGTLATQEQYPLGPHSISSDGQIIHAVWNKYITPIASVVYARSSDFGMHWETPYDLPGSGDINGTGAPSVSAFGSNVHVVWSYFTLTENNYRIKHLMSHNSGETWSEMSILAISSVHSSPTISIDKSNIVHLIWKDNDGIYYLRSLDGGINWQQSTKIVDSDCINYPSVAFQLLSNWYKNNGIYIVWTDERDGNKEIYFKRGWQIGADATAPNNGRHFVRVTNRWDLTSSFQGDKAIFCQSLDGNCGPPNPMNIDIPTTLENGKSPSIAINAGYTSWICYTGDQSQQLNCLIQRNSQSQTDYKKITIFTTPSREDSVFTSSLLLATPILGTPQNMGYAVYATKEDGVTKIRFSAFDTLREIPYYTTVLDAGNEEFTVSSPSIAITPKDLIHIVWQRNGRRTSSIYYKTTLDGATPDAIRQGLFPVWTNEYPISDPVRTEPASNPFIEAQGEWVYVVWRGPNEAGNAEFGDIWRKDGRLRPGQLPWWIPSRNVSQSRDEESNYPTMSVGTAVVWQESLPDRYQIYGEIQRQIRNLSDNDYNCKYPHTNVVPTEPWYYYMWRLLTVWTQEKMPGIYQIEYGRYDFDCRWDNEIPPIAVDCGEVNPSLYCIDRVGYLNFTDYSVDYGTELKYNIPYLNPEKYYLLEAICFNDTLTREKFVFEDSATKIIYLYPENPETLRIVLRPEHYDNTEMFLKIRKMVGENAVVAKIRLYEFELFDEHGSGPQSLFAYDNFDMPSARLSHMLYPNPVKNRTTIRYQLPFTSQVNLSIYDVQGRKIRTITNEIHEPGMYEHVWDIKDDKERKVTNGIYFYRLETDDGTAVNKMVLVR